MITIIAQRRLGQDLLYGVHKYIVMLPDGNLCYAGLDKQPNGDRFRLDTIYSWLDGNPYWERYVDTDLEVDDVF